MPVLKSPNINNQCILKIDAPDVYRHLSSSSPVWKWRQEPVAYARPKFKAQQVQYSSKMIISGQLKMS